VKPNPVPERQQLRPTELILLRETRDMLIFDGVPLYPALPAVLYPVAPFPFLHAALHVDNAVAALNISLQ